MDNNAINWHHWCMNDENLKNLLLSKITIHPETDCWEWHAPDKFDGYGKLYIKPFRGQKAHRLSYKVFKEDIPSKMFVCHKCDNRKCINPDHLFLGEAKDNIADMDSKHRRYHKHTHETAKACYELWKSGIGIGKVAEMLHIPMVTAHWLKNKHAERIGHILTDEEKKKNRKGPHFSKISKEICKKVFELKKLKKPHKDISQELNLSLSQIKYILAHPERLS
jgi:hypothetical protein